MKKLDKIQVYNKANDFIKGYDFNYTYFNNDYKGDYSHVFKRLKLNNVTDQIDRNYNHAFTYFEGNLPAKNTKNVDYWGYQNGSNYEDKYYAAVYANSKIYDGAVKNSKFDFLKIGTLSEIKYPTGGSTSFIYEDNSFDAKEWIEQIPTLAQSLWLFTERLSDPEDQDSRDFNDNCRFVLQEETEVILKGRIQKMSNGHPKYVYSYWKCNDRNYPIAELYKIDTLNNKNNKRIQYWDTPCLPNNVTPFNYMDRNIILEPGVYDFIVGSPVYDVQAEFNIRYTAREIC